MCLLIVNCISLQNIAFYISTSPITLAEHSWKHHKGLISETLAVFVGLGSDSFPESLDDKGETVRGNCFYKRSVMVFTEPASSGDT